MSTAWASGSPNGHGAIAREAFAYTQSSCHTQLRLAPSALVALGRTSVTNAIHQHMIANSWRPANDLGQYATKPNVVRFYGVGGYSDQITWNKSRAIAEAAAASTKPAPSRRPPRQPVGRANVRSINFEIRGVTIEGRTYGLDNLAENGHALASNFRGCSNTSGGWMHHGCRSRSA